MKIKVLDEVSEVSSLNDKENIALQLCEFDAGKEGEEPYQSYRLILRREGGKMAGRHTPAFSLGILERLLKKMMSK